MGFAGHLADLSIAVEHEKIEALTRAAVVVETAAKGLIGHDENPAVGPYPAWAPLAPDTIKEKTALGYVGRISAYDTEYRTGELEQSIHKSINAAGAVVGSASEVALVQEEGDPAHNLPPRSIFGAAGFKSSQKVAEIIGATVVDIFKR
ncbi:bacteriophage related protein [Acidocella aminolytica 101 = DSM 11237]|uniref:Bacteriophage related protein n=2 Tax=Acidocella TaxID=50709 RepID=A0A0D6PEZ3_9PROT|nr:bacteriophage related protein [Acidocella aminolytica 101 = DSM 11237]GBQ32008.1 hypothetical protein AA11237_0041 [Acidocella aminolytica 101 = DSM 11237]